MDERPTEDESDDARLEEIETEVVRLKRIVEQMLPQYEFTKALAEHQQLLESKIVEKELILERRRVAKVARQFEEEYPQPKEECPICFESMPTHLVGAVVVLICCGKFICLACGRNEAIDRCPLCRSDVHEDEDEDNQMALLLKHAQRGVAWAQVALGSKLDSKADASEIVDIKRHYEEQAVQWYRRASEKGSCAAERKLGKKYFHGDSLVVSRSSEEAYRWLKAAAIHGDPTAQELLGVMYCRGSDGVVEQDYAEAVFWLTNAISSKGPRTTRNAELNLGLCMNRGQGGLTVSSRRAMHYLEKAAWTSTDNGFAQYQLAVILWNHAEAVYGSKLIPGHSCVPRVLYWMRRALANGCKQAANLIQETESKAKSICANCYVTPETLGKELKSCSRCKAVWYCGRECQKKHWNDGHKVDCYSGSD